MIAFDLKVSDDELKYLIELLVDDKEFSHEHSHLNIDLLDYFVSKHEKERCPVVKIFEYREDE